MRPRHNQSRSERKPRPRIDRGLDYQRQGTSAPPEDERDLPPREQGDVEPELIEHPDPPPRRKVTRSKGAGRDNAN